MRFFKVIFATTITILGIVFIIQNLEVMTQRVQLRLDLYFRIFETPTVHLWGLVLFAFFLGVFTASLYGVYELFKQRQTIRQLRHNVEILGQELKQASLSARTASAPGESRPGPAPPSE